MVPAQVLPAAVAMPADPGPKPFDFGNELLARHLIQVLVHASP
jgi:hypothetical protein